jgi:predicted RNase H-like HicB family nuclease
MQIAVVVEPLASNGYRARGAEPLGLSADGATREEAVAKLKAQLEERLRAGTVIVPLEVPVEPHPLARFAGMFRDDPDFQEVQQIIAENRRTMDEDPDVSADYRP